MAPASQTSQLRPPVPPNVPRTLRAVRIRLGSNGHCLREEVPLWTPKGVLAGPGRTENWKFEPLKVNPGHKRHPRRILFATSPIPLIYLFYT